MFMGKRAILVRTGSLTGTPPPSSPLHISKFTLDAFEAALRHNTRDPPCALIAETHAILIYNLRTIPFTRQTAITSILNDPNASMVFGVSPDELTDVMFEVGNNWERVPLRGMEGREGWEEALIGCLTDVSWIYVCTISGCSFSSPKLASVEAFPLCPQVLTWLLFEPGDSNELPGEPSSSTHSHDPRVFTERANPSERYWTMPVEYKIALLSFMCGLSVSSKTIHLHMESCEEQLTALRKEKIEINRSKKQV